MSCLKFNGTDQYLSGTGPGPMNAAITIATLLRRGELGGAYAMVSNWAAGHAELMFMLGAGDRPVFYNMDTETSSASIGSQLLSMTTTYLVVVTRASGAVLPRFHVKDLTTPGAWEHANGSITTANQASVVGGEVRIGNFHYETVGDFNWFKGDLPLVAWWDGLNMNDTQVEEMAASPATSNLHEHSAGSPSSLTEFRASSPTDLEGLITWTNHGATLTGTDPPEWSFDGVGGGSGLEDALVKVGGVWVATDAKVRVAGAWV